MIAYRISSRIALIICFLCLLLTSCSAISGMLGKDPVSTVGNVVDTATAIAQATGSPVALGIVGVLNGIFALWAGKRAAKNKDAEHWNDEDIQSLVEALRGKGYRVEKS